MTLLVLSLCAIQFLGNYIDSDNVKSSQVVARKDLPYMIASTVVELYIIREENERYNVSMNTNLVRPSARRGRYTVKLRNNGTS